MPAPVHASASPLADDRHAAGLEPATEGVLETVPRAGVEEVDAAVAAREGGASRRGARSRRATARGCCCGSPRASRTRLEELATLEARNAGKPIGDARGEIGMVVDDVPLLRGRAASATSATRSRSPAAWR